MPYYCNKEWRKGFGPDDNGELLETQWPKPKYRPGWKVKYRALNDRTHIGIIEYVTRNDLDSLDFYSVRRLKNDEVELCLDLNMIERLEKD